MNIFFYFSKHFINTVVRFIAIMILFVKSETNLKSVLIFTKYMFKMYIWESTESMVTMAMSSLHRDLLSVVYYLLTIY